MSDSECPAYKELKDRETRAHAAWTSFLYRNEVKPRLSEKAKRKHQKEEMEAYQHCPKSALIGLQPSIAQIKTTARGLPANPLRDLEESL
jgi:hypothetical protein